MNTKKIAGEVTVVTGASNGIGAVIARLMRRRSVIDIVERFQTQHALQEEREIKNFHSLTNGALAPGVRDKNRMANNSITETEEVRESRVVAPRSTKLAPPDGGLIVGRLRLSG